MTKPLDKERLRKLLLIALSSDQPGEVMNAMVKIKKVLGLAGLDIHWLAGLIEAPSARPLPYHSRRPTRRVARAAARVCRHARGAVET